MSKFIISYDLHLFSLRLDKTTLTPQDKHKIVCNKDYNTRGLVVKLWTLRGQYKAHKRDKLYIVYNAAGIAPSRTSVATYLVEPFRDNYVESTDGLVIIVCKPTKAS